MEDIKRGSIHPEAPRSRLVLDPHGRLIPTGEVGGREISTKAKGMFDRRFRGRHNKAKLQRRQHEYLAKRRTVELSLSTGSIIHACRFVYRVLCLRTIRGRAVVGIAVVLVVLACGGSAVVYMHSRRSVGSSLGAHTTAQSEGPTPGNPPYTTILPAGQSADSLGGWYRISPPDRDPVYAYADKLGNITIDVSEQPLPDSFKANASESVANLAQGFNANQKLTVGTLTVYIGTSAKGPQSLIFVKHNLLILIRSSSIVSNNRWLQYIESLQ